MGLGFRVSGFSALFVSSGFIAVGAFGNERLLGLLLLPFLLLLLLLVLAVARPKSNLGIKRVPFVV